jgi:hypothetical protein
VWSEGTDYGICGDGNSNNKGFFLKQICQYVYEKIRYLYIIPTDIEYVWKFENCGESFEKRM